MSEPKFFTAGVSSDDFSQGTLGNCWFVAACACLAEDSKLWKKVGKSSGFLEFFLSPGLWEIS